MTFKQVPNKVDFIEQEHEILRFWKETDTFETSRVLRKGKPIWSFIDGPITANNLMGVHHGWGRTYKDFYNRYWTMRGRELRYQNGFDWQGLWVEVETEKEMGFKSKLDIEKYGLDEIVKLCRARMEAHSHPDRSQATRVHFVTFVALPRRRTAHRWLYQMQRQKNRPRSGRPALSGTLFCLL